jgi:2-polyprenyl-3-methyl-5-hydroxy-6-metoxy-1,4-benzoquinol methylase
MKYNEICKICNLQLIDNFLQIKDFTVSRETFSVVKCDNCKFVFTQFESERELGYFYDSPEYISHTNSSKGLFNSLYQRIRNHTLAGKYKLINSYGIKVSSLFDYGSGTGHFLQYCRTKNLETFGIEPSDSARAISLANGLKVSNDIEKFKNEVSRETFDVITLWHVLEHVPDLNETIEFLISRMHDKSTLFIAVPNHTSLDARYYKEQWAAYDVPRHLYHFSPDSIQKLMSKHQLEMIGMKPMWFDSYYVAMLSEKYKNGNVSYVKAIWHGFRSNLNALFNKGQCSSQIYIFKKK